MSRGRSPRKALQAALPVAWSRGIVILCRKERGSICDFMIHAAEYTSVVLVQRCLRLHGSVAELEIQLAENIGRLRLVPQCPGRFLEIWAASPRCVLRFFRITGNGRLTELCRNGDPMNVTG
jgi:hypothetical protein